MTKVLRSLFPEEFNAVADTICGLDDHEYFTYKGVTGSGASWNMALANVYQSWAGYTLNNIFGRR